jgi:hypothetical protein
MCPRLRKTLTLVTLLVFAASLTLAPGRGWAQSPDDDQEVDLGPEAGDDEFMEGADALIPPGQGEEDFTEGNQYVDESTTGGPGSVNLGLRQATIRMRQEREQFPLNLGWGAATGLVIGGWFALLNAGSNRATLQSIGTGVVLGGLLGIAIGARTVINPETPAPAPSQSSREGDSSGRVTTAPLVTMDALGVKMGVQLSF